MPALAYTGDTVQSSHSDPLPLSRPELPSCTSGSCSHSRPRSSDRAAAPHSPHTARPEVHRPGTGTREQCLHGHERLLLGYDSAPISQAEGTLDGLRAMGHPPCPLPRWASPFSPSRVGLPALLGDSTPEQKGSSRQGCGHLSDSPDPRRQRGLSALEQGLVICCRPPGL